MMYEIRFSELNRGVARVEAASKEEAEDREMEAYNAGKVKWFDSEITGISAEEAGNPATDAAPATNPDYWDCECDGKYIQRKTSENCAFCGAERDGMPDSRQREIDQGDRLAGADARKAEESPRNGFPHPEAVGPAAAQGQETVTDKAAKTIEHCLCKDSARSLPIETAAIETRLQAGSLNKAEAAALDCLDRLFGIDFEALYVQRADSPEREAAFNIAWELKYRLAENIRRSATGEPGASVLGFNRDCWLMLLANPGFLRNCSRKRHGLDGGELYLKITDTVLRALLSESLPATGKNQQTTNARGGMT